MAAALPDLDWRLVQTLLAVARTGSLSAAAHALGLSQPTTGRQVRALEAALGGAVFARHPRGLALTEFGRSLMPAAEAMAEGAARLSLAAAGREASIAGTVRITASVFVSHSWLPGILAGLREAEPEIEIELVPSDTTENLLFREADIAIRMYRPEQLDILARHLGDMKLGFFAARSYLDRHGRPETPEALLKHTLIGYDRSDVMIRGFRERGFPVSRHSFALRCDDQAVCWALLRAGCGIGIAQIGAAEAEPGLERLFADLPLPSLPVWLSAHEALRSTPRIRRVWDHLAEAIGPFLDA
ncbi:MAG: LysR family transcriptional regulator [Alphaproteobacteria bacterium]|nr:MAG: LysR family transcriptional regulator [Alphaproteobacteria bacterium]